MIIAEYELKIEKLADRFRIHLTRDRKIRVVETPCCDINDTQDRRHAIDILENLIGYLIRKNAFPEDTRIYETVDTEHGRMTTVKGWPENVVSA